MENEFPIDLKRSSRWY